VQDDEGVYHRRAKVTGRRPSELRRKVRAAACWSSVRHAALGLLALAGCLRPNPAFMLTGGDSTSGGAETSSVADASASADIPPDTTQASSTGTESAGSHGMDASASSADASASSVSVEPCGDGQLDPGEECDDGSVEDGDGCAADCRKEYRRVFVTSTVFTGDLGGLAGADAKCQAAAESVGLPGVFKAWLSADGLAPETTFFHSEVPYVRVDDVEVAADWQDLVDGQLNASMGVSETGGAPGLGVHPCEPSDTRIAWTNTQEKGTAFEAAPCNNWTDVAGTALAGGAGFSSFAWTQSCSPGCADQAALYCFEQ
jgi:cysteine-rich repeat protein